MRIVFMGTPDFAAVSLQRLLDERFDVVGVFTQPDKPKNRGMKLQPSPVKEIALAAGLPVFQPAKMRDGTALADLQSLRPDILVVVAYGRILPDDLLAVAPYGAVNVHGSLLPKYRGAAPIQWAVLNGDKITGVTIMQMADGIDTGDMLAKAETPIGEDETAGELFDRLMVLGAELLVDTIDKLDTITPQPQNDAEAIHAPMIRKEMGAIDWTQPAERVHDLVRGLNPWPSAFFTLEGKRMKLHRTKVVVGKGEPGEIAVIGGEMAVCCGENAVQLIEIQPENGKRMRGSDYLRGHAIEAKAKVQ